MASLLDPRNPIQSMINIVIDWATLALLNQPSAENPIYQLVAAHDFDPVDEENEFPDLAVVCEDYLESEVTAQTPELAIQQGTVAQGTVKLSIVVDPNHPANADRVLRGIAGALMFARRNDDTLGGRVAATGDIRASFVPPLARLANGAIGRQVSLHMDVAALVNDGEA